MSSTYARTHEQAVAAYKAYLAATGEETYGDDPAGKALATAMDDALHAWLAQMTRECARHNAHTAHQMPVAARRAVVR